MKGDREEPTTQSPQQKVKDPRRGACPRLGPSITVMEGSQEVCKNLCKQSIFSQGSTSDTWERPSLLIPPAFKRYVQITRTISFNGVGWSHIMGHRVMADRRDCVPEAPGLSQGRSKGPPSNWSDFISGNLLNFIFARHFSNFLKSIA